MTLAADDTKKITDGNLVCISMGHLQGPQRANDLSGGSPSDPG